MLSCTRVSAKVVQFVPSATTTRRYAPASSPSTDGPPVYPLLAGTISFGPLYQLKMYPDVAGKPPALTAAVS